MVSEGSYKRRVKIGHLTPGESECVARLASVIALAEYVWDDPEAAREFLTTPNPKLGDRPPLRWRSTTLACATWDYFTHEKFELSQLKDYVEEGSNVAIPVGEHFPRSSIGR